MMLASLLLTVAAMAQANAGSVPRRLEVGPDHRFATLADAVANAVPGDTIWLAPGTHAGGVIVRQSRLVVMGPKSAVVDGAHQGTIITVQADSVTLEGFTVRASGRAMDHDEAAVKLERCFGCVVRGLTVRDPLHGIYLLESHSVTIEDNDIVGATDLTESARGNGIHLFNSTGNRLLRNHVRATRDGIYFSFARDNWVAWNDVEHTRYGLHYMYSDDNQFEDNTFAENAAGAAVMFSKRIILRRNAFTRHIGYRAYGLLLQTGEGVLAEENRFEGNLTGLFLDGSVNNVFRKNLVLGNGIGIDLLASTEQNTFTENVFRHNRTSVRKVLGTGENRWAEQGRGNDWGDPDVFDLDGDGIGDRPFRAGDPFLTLAAARPALEVYSGTLAARALSWAENAFPVFAVPRVVDSAPLAPRHYASAKASAPAGGAGAPSRLPWALAATLPIAVVAGYARRRRRSTDR